MQLMLIRHPDAIKLMKKFMKQALDLAKKADPFPNPKVGAVLVKGKKILGMGYHKAAGMKHAEIVAIEDARRRSGDLRAAEGAILYVTLEPCSHTKKRTPPCTEAIISNGISKVVYAMEDPNPLVSGADKLKEAGVKVIGPTDQKKAEAINRRYIRNICKKPFVAIKMAMSADGKSATRSGDSKWISGKEAREYVHRMRSEFDAVMVGSGTIKKDDPRLTARIKGARDPYRIIVDSDLCIPAESKVLHRRDGKTIVATSRMAPRRKMSNVLVGVLSLGAMGMKKILIEGGSELNAAALEAGIVDKLYLFIAPKIIGGKEAKGVFGGKGIEKMKGAKRLKNMKFRRVGADLLLTFDVSA
jgi:diaminohydroxyphosphoribosylaminopyrimidine deaminase/5-amino-6-(5-phosphoribosylamino)uracil reductase